MTGAARFREIELGADSSWDLDDLHIEVKFEEAISPRDIANHVIDELESYIRVARNWESPTFEDLERFGAALRRTAAYTDDPTRKRDWGGAAYALEPQVISTLWTAAQVAATSIALGEAVKKATQIWKRKSLPPGSRLTLTITPAKNDDKRKQVRVIITDINTKSAKEITEEIRDTLELYSQDDHKRSRFFRRGRHSS